MRRTHELVEEIEKAMGQDLQAVDWMSSKTKEQALIKLHAVTNKIGAKQKWIDYSSVKIGRDDAIGNSERSSDFELHRQLAKIGQPVDKTDWQMSPPTVNAYYDPQENDINFPAGILQPPFWDNKMDDPVNYGAIGAVIGHELTHGFDDQGRQYDAEGNLRDWWTAEDAKKFDEREQCLVKEYSQLHGRRRREGERRVDARRKHRRQRRAAAGLHGAHGCAERKDSPEARRIYRAAAFLPGSGQIWCQNTSPNPRVCAPR